MSGRGQATDGPGTPTGAALFRQAQAGCCDSLARLMAAHEKLVHAVVRKQVSGDLPFAEALQAGRIGLWHAILGFDPQRGTAFSTYAWTCIMHRVWQATAHARALECLADLTQHPDLQDDPQCLGALSFLALSAGWSADPERSGRVGEQLLGLAQDGDQQSLMLAHWALGFSLWLRGQPVPAREHLGRALALYDPEANRPLGGLVAADPGVMAQAMLGAVLWQLGYPEQGRASLGQAVAQAQALQQPSSVAFAHYIAVMTTFAVGRDVPAALGHSQVPRPLGKVSLAYRAWVEMLDGLAQAEQAVARSDEAGLQQSLARALEAGSTWQAAGSGGGYAGLMLLQAEVCARSGQVETGLEAMDRAQACIERTGMQATEAEVWRVRGELLLMKAHRATHL